MSRERFFDRIASGVRRTSSRKRRSSRRRLGELLSTKRALRVEDLESRHLLAVAVTVDGNSVSFDGDANDTLYLTTIDNSSDHVLAYNTDGSTSYTPITSLDTSAGLEITTDADISETVLRDFMVPGADLSVTAAVAIDVEAGATLSAREIASGTSSITAHATDDSTGDSGSIRLDAPTIELASGSSLLAFVEDASRFSAGNISLTADQTGSEDDFGVASVTSSINLTDSIIKGGDVSLVANADLTANFGSDESFVGGVLDIIGLSVLGGVVRPEADAVITVDGGTVEADDLTLDADANVSSVVTVFTVFAAFAVAERSDPTADIQVTGNANIDASGDVVIDSDATSTLSVSATRFKPSGVGLYTEKVNVAVAYAKSEVTSKAIVDAGTSIVAGGAVSLTAHGEKSLDIKAITNTGRKGVFATSLTVSLDTNLVEAKLDGDVAAGGDIDVIADFKSEVNENQAFSVVGATGLNNLVKDTATVITRPSAILSAASQGGIKGGLKSIFKKSREDFTAKFGFTAGWAWSDHDNTVTARIGPGAIVESTNGSIEVSATSSDLPEISGSARSESVV